MAEERSHRDVDTLCDISVQNGNARTVEALWDRYFDRLVRLGRKVLGNSPTAAADAEDVAISAFKSFCLRAAKGQFPDISDAESIWKLLVTITVRKAQNQVKYEQRRLRLDGVGISTNGLVDPEPSPDFVAMMNDTVEHLLRRLKDVNRDVALSKMAGFTNQEIADTLKVSVPTVERKLRVIRRVWDSEHDR